MALSKRASAWLLKSKVLMGKISNNLEKDDFWNGDISFFTECIGEVVNDISALQDYLQRLKEEIQ